MHAMLCVLVELVSGVAAMLGMRNRRQVRECDSIQMPEALPLAKPDTHHEEITNVPSGLTLSLSKGEAVLTPSRLTHRAGSGTAGLPPGTRCNAAPRSRATTCACRASAGQEPGGPISRDHASLI